MACGYGMPINIQFFGLGEYRPMGGGTGLSYACGSDKVVQWI